MPLKCSFAEYHSEVESVRPKERIPLQESIIKVPLKIIEQAWKIYQTALRTKVLRGSRKRITKADFPPVTFSVDFRGSAYDFLADMEPSPRLRIFFSGEGDPTFWPFDYYTKQDTIEKHNRGNIMLNIKGVDTFSMFTHVIEHELAHFIQALINKSKETVGAGSLPKKALPKGADYYGRRKGKKRLCHTLQPVEMQTNLISVLRIIESLFLDSGIKDTPESREWFFKDIMRRILNKERPYPFSPRFTLRTLKSKNPEAYKYYLKVLYKDFMSNKSIVKRSAAMDKDTRLKMLKDIYDRNKKLSQS